MLKNLNAVKNSSITKLLVAIIIICIVNKSCLSEVEAIYCYQCNSYAQKECLDLGRSVGQPNNGNNDTEQTLESQKYLKECVPGVEVRSQLTEVKPFCRKTVFTVNSNQEHRVVRGCGWLRETNPAMHNNCYNADSEGYTQVICTCNENNCNKAASFSGTSTILCWSSVLVTLILSTLTKKT